MNVFIYIISMIMGLIFNYLFLRSFYYFCRNKGCKNINCRQYKNCPYSEYTRKHNLLK